MRVGITGATGFVGARLLSRLEGAGHELLSFTLERERPPGLHTRTAHLDLTAPISTTDLTGLDAVVHLAAFIPPSYTDAAHARTCMEVNALGTLALARACAAAGVRCFVHFSSGNAYVRQDRAVREADPLYPSARATYYLASKVAGETYADHVGRETAMRVVVLRPASIYGPRMRGGLVPTLARRLKDGQDVTLQDGGAYAVDLVFVDDVAEAAAAACEREVRGAFNVGSGVSHTTHEVARTLCSILGRGEDAITVVPASPAGADPGFSPLDVTRARAELGYTPRSLRAGLSEYVASLGSG